MLDAIIPALLSMHKKIYRPLTASLQLEGDEGLYRYPSRAR